MKDKEMRTSSHFSKTSRKQSLKITPISTIEFDWNNIMNQMKSDLEISLNEINLSNEKKFATFIWVLKKPIKQHLEMAYVKSYLQTFPNFINIIKKSSIENFDEILSRVSFYITLESLEKDNILFRNGDKGDKFYIILMGQVSILVPKDLKVRMAEKDYIKHLLKLKQLGETEILNKTFQANRHIYAIDNETLEMFSSKPQAKSEEKVKKPQGGVGYRRFVVGTSQFKDVMKFTQNITNFGMPEFDPMKISVEDYINFTKPSPELCTTNKTISEVLVWEYHLILNKRAGDTFGEVALELSSQKRTATIIATEDCQLGYLTKEVYDDCIKEANEKTRKNNITFILNSQIFKGLNKQIFERKNVFNLFINCQFTQGETLFYENAPADFLYLIKSGEYQVIMYKSLHEINALIKEFGGSYDIKNDSNNFHNDIDYNKYFSKKFKFKISNLKDKDTLGLSDYTYQGKYFCRVICTSQRGEAFKLSKHFYENFSLEEKILKDNNTEFIKVKKKLLLEKLNNLKDIKIAVYVDKYKDSQDVFKRIPNKIILKKPDFLYIPSSNKKIFTEVGTSLNKIKNITQESKQILTDSGISSKNIFLPSFENTVNHKTSDFPKKVPSKFLRNCHNNQDNLVDLTKSQYSFYKQDSNKFNQFNTSEFLLEKVLNNQSSDGTNMKLVLSNEEENKISSRKEINSFFKKLNIRTNKYSQTAIQNILNQQKLSNRRYRNTSNNVIVNRRKIKDNLNSENSVKLKPTYQILNNSSKLVNSFNRPADYSINGKDKEILNNLLDQFVDFPQKEKKLTPKRDVNVIDCLVLDKMIESYQIKTEVKNDGVYSNILNNINSKASPLQSVNTLIQYNSTPSRKHTSNKNIFNMANSPTSNYTVDKSIGSKKDVSTYVKVKPNLNFYTIDTEKFSLINENSLGEPGRFSPTRLRPKKYKLINTPSYK